MTKKHFKKLAVIIKEVKDENTKCYLIVTIGEFCKEQNPLFNWDKWKGACK